jgi:formylglycine-generating enzyme required for sulfatase activity
MRAKRNWLLSFFMCFMILSLFLYSQDKGKPAKSKPSSQPVSKTTVEKKDSGFDAGTWLPIIISAAGLVFVIAYSVYTYLKRKKNRILDVRLEEEEKEKIEREKQALTMQASEQSYRNALKKNLGSIHMFGSPDIESKIVDLEEAFVSLRISQYWRSENRFDPSQTKHVEISPDRMEEIHYLSPEEVIRRAFEKYPLLLVIGDPGSGKTTLLQYYAVTCLDISSKGNEKLGLEPGILPVYFPLRELVFDDKGQPVTLPECLAKWSDIYVLDISRQQFVTWLREKKTLILLDGLDEIDNKDRRKAACQWIKAMTVTLENARFVVTSRATGYRKLDGIELEVSHMRADILDFSPHQQALFLRKWFRAVFLDEFNDEKLSISAWKSRQEKLADRRSKAIIDFLGVEKNKSVRELAAVPMLLQIMAIIWQDRQLLPESRSELYDAALNYLLDYRDRRRDIKPVLRAEKARRILAKTALWMQEVLRKDEVKREEMHRFVQTVLNKFQLVQEAEAFCVNLRDRAGLIADYDKDNYIFRHKSFREFLAALQLVNDAGKPDRLESLVACLDDDWWEETLRFFMSKADDEVFDRFMRLLFQPGSPVSGKLDAHSQNLLRNLVLDAPLKRIDGLKECLNNEELNDNQRRYIMDCLKTIGTPEAIQTIEQADKALLDESNISYAEDIVLEAVTVKEGQPVKVVDKEIGLTGDSFRNPFEGNVEYIKIPGGTYTYSVTREFVRVPDFHLCKYPVTNQRYRRFIAYMDGKEKEFGQRLRHEDFTRRLLKLSDYLGTDLEGWQEKFRSRYDDDKKFNGADQPVVGVTWYAARAYCFWLSCLEAAAKESERLQDIEYLASLYRLPTETEWEWAAGGEPDGTVRKYPWLANKGEPTPELANYGQNVSATTPVGRYPEGATPTGLMDMAGNVWEWMGNYSSDSKNFFALRGGSWDGVAEFLRCSARSNFVPRYEWNNYGFRVLRAQSRP